MELTGDHVASTYRLTDKIEDMLAADDRRIVITGAGGWLGLATLELLANALKQDFPERIACFGSQSRRLTLRDGRSIAQQPLEDIERLPSKPSLVLHLAYLTKDRAEHIAPDAYRRANRKLSETVLHALDTIGAEALFLPSSGAAAVADLPTAGDAMRAYGLLKREDEEIFSAWALGNDRLALITRVFNISGPYINKPEAYALSAFIRDALAGKAVEVKAKRRVMRSYVAIRELMSVVFGLLLSDRTGAVRFDTASDEELEMREIGQRVANLVGGGELLAEKLDPDLVADVYVGDRSLYDDLRRSVSVEAVPFAVQITETAAYLAAAA